MTSTATSSTRFNDLAYGWLYSGAIGGSVIALFFLGVDVTAGHPFFTPSLLGSVLFFDAEAATYEGMNLTAVALFTIFHVGAFFVLGGIGSFLHQRLRENVGFTELPTGLTLLVLSEGGFLLAAATLLPGVAARLGHGLVLTGNTLAAVAMAAFLGWAYRQRPANVAGGEAAGGQGSKQADSRSPSGS
ncbi:MAG: hypothetical protein WD995_10410 [Gemmatimonadota bacterium]